MNPIPLQVLRSMGGAVMIPPDES